MWLHHKCTINGPLFLILQFVELLLNFWPGTLPESSKLSHFLHYRLPTVESFVDYFGIMLGRERGLSSFVFEGETNP